MNKYSKLGRALKRGSPTILSIMAIAGVVATGYFAAKGGMEAKSYIDADNLHVSVGKEDKKGRFKRLLFKTWTCYIPAGLSGAATTACIILSNRISRKQILALSATAALLSERYSEYQERVNQAIKQLPEEQQEKFKSDMQKKYELGPANSVLELPDGIDEDALPLFYEGVTGTFFRSTIEKVQSAEYHVNRNLILRGYVPINEWLEFLGINNKKYDDSYGWDMDQLILEWESEWMDIDHRTIVTDTGEAATAIYCALEPHYFD